MGPGPGRDFRLPPASHRGDPRAGSDPVLGTENPLTWSNTPNTTGGISRVSPDGVGDVALAFLSLFLVDSGARGCMFFFCAGHVSVISAGQGSILETG